MSVFSYTTHQRVQYTYTFDNINTKTFYNLIKKTVFQILKIGVSFFGAKEIEKVCQKQHT